MAIPMRNRVSVTVLSVLLMAYAFFSPIETFLGTAFETVFRYMQYLLALVLLIEGSILKGRLSMTDEHKSPVVPYLLLLVFSVVSILWSRDTAAGLSYLKSNVLRLLMIILAFQLNLSKDTIRKMLIAFMLGTVVLAFMVTQSSITASTVVRTSLLYRDEAFDTNNLSGYLVMGFAVLLNFRFDKKTWNVIRYICCGVCALAVLMTGSRGGIVAAIGAVLFTGLIQKNLKSTVKYLVTVVVGVVVLLFLMRWAGVRYVSNVIDRFLNDTSGSGGERLIVWGYSLRAALSRPLLGYGIGSAFTVLHQDYGSNIGTHNVFLTFLLDGGVVGLGLFLSCLYRSLRAKRNAYTDMAKVMIVASMLVSLFMDTYNKKILWLPLLFYALAFSIRPEDPDEVDHESTGS